MEALDALLQEVRDEVLQAGSMGSLSKRVEGLRLLLEREGVVRAADSPFAAAEEDTDDVACSPIAEVSRPLPEGSGLPFHIHRNAPFLKEVTLKARHWVHFHALCKYGHWHGTAHRPQDCEKCVRGCGGGAWTREKVRDGESKLTPPERKRISSLLTQAMHIALHRSRRNNPYKNFKRGPEAEEKAALRISYHVSSGTWKQRPVAVHIEEEPFAAGAMRRCWRMIESPGTTPSACVAKRYIKEDANPAVYWVDTKMQAVAKHYAGLFSRHPKCINTIDFIEAYMIRDGPLSEVYYSIEHFLEGTYVKHNNNAGGCFGGRNTPQAFSHFTWVRSGGKLMVVDIQGVGNLYTDPQIHSIDGKGYGEGNLGLTGMALFLNSHRCNYVCQAMGLKPFDVYPGAGCGNRNGATVKQMAASLASGQERSTAGAGRKFADLPEAAVVPNSLLLNGGSLLDGAFGFDEEESRDDANESHCEEVSCDQHLTPPPDLLHNPTFDASEPSVGAVHMRLAQLYATGRFSDGRPHVEPAFYHLQMAAMHHHIPGLLGVARMYSGLDRTWLLDLKEVPEHRDLTVILLERAFERGSKEAAWALAALLSDNGYVGEGPLLATVARCLEALAPDADPQLSVVSEEYDDFGWGNFSFPELRRLTLLADTYERQGGPEAIDKALTCVEAAADLAMSTGKGSQAAKLYVRTEELRALLDIE